VERSICALNEAMERFTNLMSSVSQSALILQQSVATMDSRFQTGHRPQHSMVSLLPNQPLYTSLLPTAVGPQMAADPQSVGPPGTGGHSKSGSLSMLEVIKTMSHTQGGPDDNQSNVGAEHVRQSNVAEQHLLIQQQQQLLALQQQALRLRASQLQPLATNQSQRANEWVNAKYAKPVLSAQAAASSPILHSTAHSLGSTLSPPQRQREEVEEQPVLSMLSGGNRSHSMALSGGSEQQPGTAEVSNQSKSKIFEHKKALRNVSPEMERKLQELHAMGYRNRTFNLVLLKQENGDLEKVVENLKQFYQNN